MPDAELKKFEDLWYLQDSQILACTHSSNVYSVQYKSKPAVLKIIKPESDEHQSPEILHYFDGKGAVQLFESQDNALLLEYLEPQPLLKSMVAEGMFHNMHRHAYFYAVVMLGS